MLFLDDVAFLSFSSTVERIITFLLFSLQKVPDLLLFLLLLRYLVCLTSTYVIKYNIRILRFIIQNLKTVITSLNQYCQDSRHVLKDGTSENKLG